MKVCGPNHVPTHTQQTIIILVSEVYIIKFMTLYVRVIKYTLSMHDMNDHIYD